MLRKWRRSNIEHSPLEEKRDVWNTFLSSLPCPPITSGHDNTYNKVHNKDGT